MIDAGGLLVLPGGIDPHVHLGGIGVDDYTSGSAAALAGGITTISNFGGVRDGETPAETLARATPVIEAEAIADLIYHPIVSDPGVGGYGRVGGTGRGRAADHQGLHGAADVRRAGRRVRGYDALGRGGRRPDAGALRGRRHRRRYRGAFRGGGARRAGELRRCASGGSRRGRHASRDRDGRGDRRADLHRPPVVGARDAGGGGSAGARPPRLRRDPAHLPAPDAGALRRTESRPSTSASRRCGRSRTRTRCGRGWRGARSMSSPRTTSPTPAS